MNTPHPPPRLVELITRFAIWLVVVTIVGQALLGLASFTRRQWIDRIPTETYFEYDLVAYDGTTLDGKLRMHSLSVWHQQVDRVVWVDVLMCRTDGVWAVYSTQEFPKLSHGPDPLNVSPWFYTAPWPADGSLCYMDSTISAEVSGTGKSLDIKSERFVPGQPRSAS